MGSEEEFADTISLGSGDTVGRPGSLRHSRYTLYHSALDLEEAGIATPEEAHLFPGNSNGPISHKPGGTMFRDGVRCVDFVLVWQENEVGGGGGGSGGGRKDRAIEAQKKRRLFENRLAEDEGLETEEEVVERMHFVKLHAPREVLRRYSEILRLRMPMREVPGQEELIKADDDYDLMTEVKSMFARAVDCLRIDTRLFPEDKFRLTAEYSRHKSYLFDEAAADFFSPQVRTLVVDFILERTSFDDAGSLSAVGIQKLISDDVYKAAYPLHDGGCEQGDSLRCLLLREWAQIKHWAKYQPVDQIREYFGVKYALYFAWLGFYTHMLVPASIVGIVVFLYGCITLRSDTLSRDICDESLDITMCPLCDRTCDYWRLSDTCSYARVTYLIDNPLTIIFAVFMSFWATLFLELWKRYSAAIAHRWGLTDYCAQSEPPRAQYLSRVRRLNRSRTGGSKLAKVRRDLVTGMTEPYVSFWRVRLPATIVSFSVVLLLIAVAVAAVFGVVLYRMSVFASVSLNADPDWVTTYAIIVIPSTAAIINLVCIMILNWVYDKLAVLLTELEMHRTQAEFDESLTVKIYLFQFVNYYTSIMYIAFLKGKFVGYPAKYNRVFGLRQEECSPGGCLMELCIQLAIIMVGQQAYNGVIEMLIPFLMKQLNGLRMRGDGGDRGDAAKKDSSPKQWTEDYKLLDWGPRGLFYEYLEMVMQYGFVTIFVTAFPLAPFFALLNNVFEMRLDAKKFLEFYRRPVPRRAPDIGVWFRILNVLGRLAVISNAFIIAFSSNFVPRLVYMLTVSGDRTDAGFLEHSLSHFDTSDFAPNTSPRASSFNVTTCRYSQYREPPFISEPAKRYKRGSMYWHVLAARLAFIVIFQNVVSLVTIAVQWCIPDVPAKLRDQIKKEAYLTNEIIIRHETARAKNAFSGDASRATQDFVDGEVRSRSRRANKKMNEATTCEEIELRERKS